MSDKDTWSIRFAFASIVFARRTAIDLNFKFGFEFGDVIVSFTGKFDDPKFGGNLAR